MRYQCGVFGLGWVIALLVHERKWQQAVLNSAIMGCAAMLAFALGQLQDAFIWGEPFAQLGLTSNTIRPTQAIIHNVFVTSKSVWSWDF